MVRTVSSRLTPINDAYEPCERTAATLWVGGDDLDPVLVTADLGIEPTETQNKGQIRKTGRAFSRKVRKGGWFLSSEGYVDSKDVRRHIDWLLMRLIPIKDKLRSLQEVEGVRMSVNCIWWSASGTGGPTLWPEQMARLAELNLECGFDVSFYE